MKKLLLLSVAAVVAFGATESYAQTAPSAGTAKADGTAKVAIVSGMTITAHDGVMNFGGFLSKEQSQEAILGTDGNITGSAATNKVTIDQNAPKAGQFTISGTPNTQFSISTSDATLTDKGSKGGEKMTVTQYTYDFDGSTTDGSNIVLKKASAELKIGGTLTIGANQVASNYDGAYTVTIKY